MDRFFFDTSTIRSMNAYYPGSFSSFWYKIDNLTLDGTILSVDQVLQELGRQRVHPRVDEWVETHKHIFRTPTSDESQIVAGIFAIPKFRESLQYKKISKKGPHADPWVIAAAKVNRGWVVTEETEAENSAKIPNICEHFGVECINMEQFINLQGWRFS